MKLFKIFYVWVGFALLAGCVNPSLGVSSTKDKVPTEFFSPTPAQLSTPEVTIEPPKESFTIQSYCPEITLDSSQLPSLSGTLVFSGDNILVNNVSYSPKPGNKSLLLFWDAQTEDKVSYQLLQHQIYYYYVTSPDQEKLAFTEGKTMSFEADVFVLNHDGLEVGKITLPGDWTLFDWLSNEKLLSRQIRLRGENLDLVAMDPITGEREFLSSDFPNLYSNGPAFFWGGLTIFNPTTSFVAYPEVRENEIVSILWDVQNNKEISSIMGLSRWPRWAPDGSRLLIVVDYASTPTDSGHEEIFLLKPSGEVTRLTFFKEHFEHNIIDLPRWSPNGRYVAFWQRTNLSGSKLAVFDTETLTVDLFCHEMNPYPLRFGELNTLGYAYYQVNSAPPIWSPDSQYLLIENHEQATTSTYLFDLQNHTIAKIADNARPVSWMK